MKRSGTIFYFLSVYVFAFFFWWTYLLFNLSKETYTADMALIHAHQNDAADLQKHDRELQNKYHVRLRMLFWEGTFFLATLLFGLIKIKQSFNKDIALSYQQNNFLLSVTHELKSPLSAIKLSLQTLIKRNLDTAQADKMINNSLEEVERLQILVDNMLLAAKIEHHAYIYQKEDIDLSKLISDIYAKFNTLYGESFFHSSRDIQPDLFVRADELALSSVFSNLIENAIKYSFKGAFIQVKLYQKEQKIIFEIRDEGIGILEKEKSNIFKKFYRIGNEETRKTKGTGLGLFIVKKVIEDHHGKITVENNQPKGSIFIVTLG